MDDMDQFKGAAIDLVNEIDRTAYALAENEPIALRLLTYRAGGMIRTLIEHIVDTEKQRSVTIQPGAVSVTLPEGVTPADVAKRVSDRITREFTEHVRVQEDGAVHTQRRPGPPQKFQMGEITDRDRFLDDASDRRAALMAASRVFADAKFVSPDSVINMTKRYYDHLREGKA